MTQAATARPNLRRQGSQAPAVRCHRRPQPAPTSAATARHSPPQDATARRKPIKYRRYRPLPGKSCGRESFGPFPGLLASGPPALGSSKAPLASQPGHKIPASSHRVVRPSNYGARRQRRQPVNSNLSGFNLLWMCNKLFHERLAHMTQFLQ